MLRAITPIKIDKRNLFLDVEFIVRFSLLRVFTDYQTPILASALFQFGTDTQTSTDDPREAGDLVQDAAGGMVKALVRAGAPGKRS